VPRRFGMTWMFQTAVQAEAIFIRTAVDSRECAESIRRRCFRGTVHNCDPVDASSVVVREFALNLVRW